MSVLVRWNDSAMEIRADFNGRAGDAARGRGGKAMRRPIALAAFLLLSGCSVSAVGVKSTGMGYQDAYVGVGAAAEHSGFEAEAWAYPDAKRGSQGNLSASGRLLWGGSWWKVGAYGSYTDHPDWSKGAVSPMALLRLDRRTILADLYAIGPDGDKVEWSAGVRLSGQTRLAPLIEVERVRHTAGWGERVVLGVVWKARR